MALAVEGAVKMVSGEATVGRHEARPRDGDRWCRYPPDAHRAGEFLAKVAGRIGSRLEVEHSQIRPLVLSWSSPSFEGRGYARPA